MFSWIQFHRKCGARFCSLPLAPVQFKDNPLHRCIARFCFDLPASIPSLRKNSYEYKSQWNKFLGSSWKTPENTSSSTPVKVLKTLCPPPLTHSRATDDSLSNTFGFRKYLFIVVRASWVLMIVFHLMSTYLSIAGVFVPFFRTKLWYQFWQWSSQCEHIEHFSHFLEAIVCTNEARTFNQNNSTKPSILCFGSSRHFLCVFR